MTVEELLREAQYQFHCVGYGDTRGNRKHRARAISLAKKVIRKSPASSEARQANDLLIRLSGEHFASKMEQRHKHPLAEPKHSHADLRRTKREQSTKQGRQENRFSGSEQSNLTPSSMLAAIVGLKVNYLMTGVAVLFFFLLIFGFFFPLLLLAAVVFAGPLRGNKNPKSKQQANRAMQVLYTWMLNNQR